MSDRRGRSGLYKVGDKVVYPHHGAGTVIKKDKRKVLGEEREYLTIQILHNDMTVNVPTENADRVGLRKVIDGNTVEQVLKALRGSGTTMPKNWNRRFKHNRDKMKTGDIFELAEVVRNLSLRDHEKGLSTGEKQMFVKAKKILASELMYAKAMDEDEAAAWLDEVVGRVLEPLGEGWDGAVLGVPIADTVKRVSGDAVVETVSRDDLVVVQTPQAFVAPVLRSAAAGARDASDCAGLVERAGGRVKVVPGDPRLRKVTDASDLE